MSIAIRLKGVVQHRFFGTLGMLCNTSEHQCTLKAKRTDNLALDMFYGDLSVLPRGWCVLSVVQVVCSLVAPLTFRYLVSPPDKACHCEAHIQYHQL